MLLEHGTSLLNPKVASQSTAMELLDEEFSKHTFGYAKSSSLEKESFLDMEKTVGMARTLGINVFEVLIFRVHPFDYFKHKDFGL